MQSWGAFSGRLLVAGIFFLSACSKEAEHHEESKSEEAEHGAAASGADAHSAAAPGHEVHWAYMGEGSPDKWGELKGDYATCKIGGAQSPVDLQDSAPVKADDLAVSYNPIPLKVLNNGHTIQIQSPGAGTLTVGGKTYTLAQMHFHTPSEHTVNGKAADMELHLVHKNEAGELAVLGLMLNKGTESPLVQQIWSNLPTEVNAEKEVAGVTLDLKTILPTDMSHYHYVGSLTTPPCSEGVQWYVLKTPATVSEAQVVAFAGLFQTNARPVQPLNGRELVKSN